MQLSINYSPQTAGLLHGGDIALDRWKCSEWPELIAGAQATGLSHYLHFDLQAGPGDIQDMDLDHLAAACAASGSPDINLHVATRRKETGSSFLLDIAHARTAAHHLGYDEHTYLASLPVERLRALHVSGVGRDEQGRLREHMSLSEQDWALLEWCLEQIRQGQWARPWVVAFEYGGIGSLFVWRSESKVLAEQVPRLYTLLGACR